jgi:hypothetical protein
MFERVQRLQDFDEVFKSTVESPIAATRTRARYVVGDANDAAEHRADAVADHGMAALQQR